MRAKRGQRGKRVDWIRGGGVEVDSGLGHGGVHEAGLVLGLFFGLGGRHT